MINIWLIKTFTGPPLPSPPTLRVKNLTESYTCKGCLKPLCKFDQTMKTTIFYNSKECKKNEKKNAILLTK